MSHLYADLVGKDINWKQVILIGFMPFFLIASVAEWQYMSKSKKIESFKKDYVIVNILCQLIYRIIESVFNFVLIFVPMNYIYEYRFFNVKLSLLTIIPLYLFQEFCYYWLHRANHRIRWFWMAHSVHHSGEMMNLSVAARQGFLSPFTGYWIFFIPMLLIGVTPTQVFILYGIDLSFQFFLHTEAVGKMPIWFEFIFNTPSHHRVHHGCNKKYIDKNYGGSVILFDRLFGTFQAETEKVKYGVMPRVKSNNVIIINFHEPIRMLMDILNSGTFWRSFMHLWMPPEWKHPNRKHLQTENIKPR